MVGKCYPADQIYDLIKNGPGTSSLEAGGRKAKGLQEKHDEIVQDVQRLRGRMEASWKGNAAAAAHAGAGPLAKGFEDAGRALSHSQSSMQGQVTAFKKVDQEVVKVEPKNPPEKGTWDSVTPWDTDTEDAINEHKAASETNIRVYNTYTQSTASNTDIMPKDFGQPPKFGGDIGADSPHRSSGGGQERIQAPTSGGGGTSSVAGGGGDGGDGYSGGPVSAPPTTGGSGPSTPSTSVPQPSMPNVSQPPMPGPDTGSTTAASYTPPGGGFGPGGGQGSGFGPVGGGSGNPSGGFVPGGGFGPGAGGGGGSGAGGFGGRSGMPGGGSAGQGPGAGVGPRSGIGGTGGAAGAPGGTGATGGAAGTGGRGMMGAPMGAGGARGQGGDDDEHQAAQYLTAGDDPENIFGTDQPTAPPVIGE